MVRLLLRLGYAVVRQRGSHIWLTKMTSAGEHHITVPAHRVIAKGTINDVLTKVSIWNVMSKEDLIAQLR
ncbi:MAG: type II toxin-antitoxin system HicA family toxin [Dehalococcoidia bacterium]|nr:type II toxin-antitoxin system HicA family toxin [Dehalococcoidia bacterium]